MTDPMATLQDYLDGCDDLTDTQCEAVDAVAARLKAWDELMAMWEDPANAEDLNGGDVVEVLGQLRTRLGYVDSEPSTCGNCGRRLDDLDAPGSACDTCGACP